MNGIVQWYNPRTEKGIVLVTEDGMVSKYFLLYSKIIRSPEVIEAGQFVKFAAVAPPHKIGLLPVMVGVEISRTPFVTESDVKGGL